MAAAVAMGTTLDTTTERQTSKYIACLSSRHVGEEVEASYESRSL